MSSLPGKKERKKYTGKKERKKYTGKKERKKYTGKKERKKYTGEKGTKKETYRRIQTHHTAINFRKADVVDLRLRNTLAWVRVQVRVRVSV